MSGGAPPDHGSIAGPTVPRMLLGTRLRRLRESQGISARVAADAIRGSESKISRIELGRNAVREVDVMDLLSLYGVTDYAERDQLLALAGQANEQAWWQPAQDVLPAWSQPYIGLEDGAQFIRSYDAQCVPGLLQTEDYAEALIRLGPYSAAQVAQRVGVRMQRQRRLTEGLELRAVIDEAVLRRIVGSTRLMRAQLEHLLTMSSQPGLNIQVAPLSTSATYAAPCSFTILHFAAEELPDMVYVEQLMSALYLDKPLDVERYAAVLEELSATSTTAGQTTDIIEAISADLDPRA